jgi:DNA-binding LytR/AlgR family response regulator
LLYIAICESNPAEQRHISALLATCGERLPEPFTIDVFENGSQLLSAIATSGAYDLICMEAVLPGFNGIETAREIRRRDADCQIVFITSAREFAVSSYRVDALDYLLKPITKNELSTVLDKAARRIFREDNAILRFQAGDGFYSVRHSSIRYLASEGHKINIILSEAEPIRVYGRLDAYDDLIGHDDRFIRIHKSFLVNADFVLYFGTDSVELVDHTQLKVSRAYAKSAKEKFYRLMVGKRFP